MFLSGIDRIYVQHLEYGNEFLYVHLSLLYQTIFSVSVELDNFCMGVIKPISKKGKGSKNCTSYSPITVSSIPSEAFELLIVDAIDKICKISSFTFAFHRG